MTSTMAILLIGDELLDGRVQDQNARFLIQSSLAQGIRIQEVRIVPDDQEVIIEALEALSFVDRVVVSGGLGPTADDITRDAAARFSGQPLKEDPDLLQALRTAFQSRGYPFTENNRRQCSFPADAEILPTEVGTAAGFRLDRRQRQYFFFPGVPREFRWFVRRYISADVGAGPRHRSRMIFFGLGESDVETRIKDGADLAQKTGVRIGYRAERSLIEVILKGEKKASDLVETLVRAAIGPWLVAEEEESFTERLARRLLEAEATVSVAESCTAGLLGARLTDISGSSAYFQQGFLTYSNEAKTTLLGVSPETLETKGAVSKEVVLAMATGARERSDSTFALAISGIAGPTGGSPEKPVGTVDFALAAPEGIYYRRALFARRSRQDVRTLSVHTAAALLLWRLEERLQEHALEGPFPFPP